jgi:hypothetical protein
MKKNSELNYQSRNLNHRFVLFRKKKEGRLPHILSKKAQTLRGIK